MRIKGKIRKKTNPITTSNPIQISSKTKKLSSLDEKKLAPSISSFARPTEPINPFWPPSPPPPSSPSLSVDNLYALIKY
jgi:hypothetical protein